MTAGFKDLILVKFVSFLGGEEVRNKVGGMRESLRLSFGGCCGDTNESLFLEPSDLGGGKESLLANFLAFGNNISLLFRSDSNLRAESRLDPVDFCGGDGDLSTTLLLSTLGSLYGSMDTLLLPVGGADSVLLEFHTLIVDLVLRTEQALM